MKRVLPVLIWTLCAAGCLRPFRVTTTDRIIMDSPVNGHFSMEMTPIANGGPVVAMPVDGTAPCQTGAKVAIVDVDGLLVDMDLTGPYSLGENPVALFHEKLLKAASDPSICGIVVRINSPGGGVAATDMMWRELQSFRTKTRRPVVACLMDVGTGGAYYLASASDQIIAHPQTITGGIGVIVNLYNLADTMGYFNIRYQPIKAGQHIDMGSTATALTGTPKELLQSMADEFHEKFQQVVKQGRPRMDSSKEGTFDGRVFTAKQALERGLIDQVGYLEDAVAVVRQLAQQNEAQVVLLHRANDPAHSPYAISPNVPLQGSSPLSMSVPGLDRSRLPSFLYMWSPEPTLERSGGK